MFPEVEQLTHDGYDLQFGTNVLGHAYFTKLLLPALLAAAQRSSSGIARVVNVSSSAHEMGARTIDFDTLEDSPARKELGTTLLYGQSKLVRKIFYLPGCRI